MVAFREVLHTADYARPLMPPIVIGNEHISISSVLTYGCGLPVRAKMPPQCTRHRGQGIGSHRQELADTAYGIPLN
jgi:hypothetical protein